MAFAGRNLDSFSLEDLQTLVRNRVPEGPNLEYKETAYSGRPQDIREMLRDVTALANAEGGYLIMGIREDAYGRAETLTPIEDAHTRAKAIQHACLDGIQERIQGIQVKVIETAPDQGIIVIHVPLSEQRPHMMVRDHSTDFFRRYNTDKRPMNIGEIREMVLANPRFRKLVELEVLAQRGFTAGPSSGEISEPPYIQLLTERSVERFLQRYMITSARPQVLVLVSPFIGDLVGQLYSLQDLVKRLGADQTRAYVVTRPPRDEYHRAGLAVLEQSPYVEIRYNSDVHAKLYVAWNREEEDSFALFGSGNLTASGLRYNLELGMMILSRGQGRALVRDLYQWGSQVLRTVSTRVKPITIQNPRGD